MSGYDGFEHFGETEPNKRKLCCTCKHRIPYVAYDTCDIDGHVMEQFEILKRCCDRWEKDEGGEKMNDLISRADAIEAVNKEIYHSQTDRKTVVAVLSSLPSAEAEPTVIRSRTLMPTKDFKEWAERIREVNPNAVVIPCDAEVVSAEAEEHRIYKDGYNTGKAHASADAVQGWIPCSERLPKIDETLSLCDQISDEVLGTDTHGNIRHVYLTNCGYLKPTFCTVEEGMSVDIVAWTPLPEPYEEVER